jgi:hypothetical protein
MPDAWWDFTDHIEQFESLSVDVTIDRDFPNGWNLYVAPVGVAFINGFELSGGLQTTSNGWAAIDCRKRVSCGRCAIFSRWSSDKDSPVGLDYVRVAADGLYQSSDREGEFCGVIRPFSWNSGDCYTYSIVKGDTETIEKQPYTWFHCFIRTHSTGDVTTIGSLCFEGREFTFWERHAASVEVYPVGRTPKSDIPKVSVTFGHPLVNGVAPALKNSSINHLRPSGGAGSACATDSVVASVASPLALAEAEYRHRPAVVATAANANMNYLRSEEPAPGNLHSVVTGFGPRTKYGR